MRTCRLGSGRRRLALEALAGAQTVRLPVGRFAGTSFPSNIPRVAAE